MRWVAILAASAAAHAGVLVAVPATTGRPLLPPPAPVVEVEPAAPIDVEVVVAAAEPMEVTLLTLTVAPPAAPDDLGPSPTPPPTLAPTLAPTLDRRPAAIATATTAPAPGPVDPAAGGATVLGMRAGDAVRPETPARRAPPPVALGVPADSDVIAKILERPSDPGVAPSGELIAQRDGSYVKDDLMFVAAVEPDGTVHFDDKPNFNYKFHLPIPTPSQVKHHLAHWVEDPYGGAVGQYASVNRDGTDDDNDGKLDEGQTVRVLSGGFDVTDWVMRSHGEDPYSSRKLAFLDRTRDERVQIGQVYRTRQLEAADQYMLAHLTKLWRRDDLDAAARREAIFELWDDCAETGEEAVVAAAVRARAALLRFVDVTLPRGSDDAFTDDEVARFNARRRSAATFAPYP